MAVNGIIYGRRRGKHEEGEEAEGTVRVSTRFSVGVANDWVGARRDGRTSVLLVTWFQYLRYIVLIRGTHCFVIEVTTVNASLGGFSFFFFLSASDTFCIKHFHNILHGWGIDPFTCC